jgi:D-ribulokinase
MKFYIGVDVGTNSARIGLFDQNGQLVESRVEPLSVYNLKLNFYEQSSEEIWAAVCHGIEFLVVKDENSGLDLRNSIESVGFDATCSLVVLDDQFKPVSVSPSGTSSINVIMWMDHRSNEQAEFINNSFESTKNTSLLKTVGGRISLEMDPPKILWLKQNLNEEVYAKAAHFFSLPDYLVWRSSRVEARSVCTTTCKWLLRSAPNGVKEWDGEFWATIDLGELREGDFGKIGKRVELPFGVYDDLKITNEFARACGGLADGVKVGVSMIDAHAGGIGAIALTQGYFGVNSPIEFEDVLGICE